MESIRRFWIEALARPCLWLYRYFFQPDKFMSELELSLRTRRTRLLLRLTLPMFLVCYPVVVIFQYLHDSAPFTSNWTGFLLNSAFGCLLGIALGIAWDFLANLFVGVVGGMWLGIVTGIWINNVWQFDPLSLMGGWTDYCWQIVIAIVLTPCGGLALGASIQGFTPEHFSNVSERIRVIGRKPVNTASDLVDQFTEFAGTVALAMAGGRGIGLNRLYARRIGMVLWSSILGSLLVAFIAESIGKSSSLVETLLLEGIIVIPVGILGGIAIFFTEKRTVEVTVGIGGGILVGGFGYGGSWADILVVATCFATALAWFGSLLLGTRCVDGLIRSRLPISLLLLLVGIVAGIVAGLCAGGLIFFAFALYYIFSYCRLPLYPASFLSSSKAYFAGQENPEQIFTYLRSSPLHWGEYASLSFPFMGKCMVLAGKQDTRQTMEEISFIAIRNPHLLWIAQFGFLEIIIHGLEVRKDTHELRRWVRDIVDVTTALAPFLLQADAILDPSLDSIFASDWAARLDSVNLAIQDAQRFSVSLGWQTRHDALKSMRMNLGKARGPFGVVGILNKFERNFNSRLNAVIARWRVTAEYELTRIEQEPHTTNHISDPYVVGPPLDEPGTSLFVGRRDLAQQLEEVLGKNSHRPTFFLIGERRMGKTSTLKQLPSLLDTRHFLPIFYDLLAPEMISSAPAFLMTVAEALTLAIREKGMQIKSLEMKRLEEASQKNEATVYFAFNEWLKEIELILERNDLVALLAFDEFERLEKVRQEKYFDLDLLFNWFRSIIQGHPRFGLLFSGGKTFEDIQTKVGMDWSGYFVHVRMLKVSFLQYKEALQLITHPIPDYPIAQIFGEGVVDEIIKLTYGHPFLVQAICSDLVSSLNAQDRDHAVLEDLGIAVNNVLEERWGNYFQDLWNRTDAVQRTCLIALYQMGEGDLQGIMQHIQRQNEPLHVSLFALRRALRTLVQRDLILLHKEGVYRITAPIFAEWVKRNR